jgi:D-alanine-D-alanine ligase-like ATP-grasp enzyme
MNFYVSIFLFLFKILTPILSFFKIIKWNTDIEKCISIRSKVIWEEALKRNIKIKQLVVLWEYSEIFEAEIKGKKYLFKSLPKPSDSYERGDLWLDDKFILKQKLLEKNIAVPKGGSAKTLEEAVKIFEKISKPVIVKPRLGSRGRHTTTNINNIEDLEKAFYSAKILSKYVVVEEHLFGSVYRGTIVGGEVVGILEGMPPRVKGDGISSIKDLILKKNKNKIDPIKDVIINEYLIKFLERQNLTLESVLEKNREIDLLEKIGVSYGGSSRELIKNTHKKIIKELENAAKVVGNSVVGFDFIIKDPVNDPDMQHWGIIECNSLPFINLHHFPIEGNPENVASKIWDLWKDTNNKNI